MYELIQDLTYCKSWVFTGVKYTFWPEHSALSIICVTPKAPVWPECVLGQYQNCVSWLKCHFLLSMNGQLNFFLVLLIYYFKASCIFLTSNVIYDQYNNGIYLTLFLFPTLISFSTNGVLTNNEISFCMHVVSRGGSRISEKGGS